MRAEIVNRWAMWGTIVIAAVAGVVFAGHWAFGQPFVAGAPPLVAELVAPAPSSTPDVATPIVAAHSAEAGDGTTITRPATPVTPGGHPVAAVAPVPGTTSSTTTLPTTTVPATIAAPTTTAAPPPTTTPGSTVPTSTTSTSTTLAATTTTTTAATTTTTTTPPTTTTAPTTTTTSTTVASTVPGLFVERFDGRTQSDPDAWSVLVDVTLGATESGTWRAQVYVFWTGDGSGSVVLDTGGSGKASATIGPFSSGSVTLVITNVRAPGWVYMPELNQAATTLTVVAPAG